MLPIVEPFDLIYIRFRLYQKLSLNLYFYMYFFFGASKNTENSNFPVGGSYKTLFITDVSVNDVSQVCTVSLSINMSTLENWAPEYM